MFSDVVMPDISGIILAAKLYELLEPPEVALLSGIPGFSLEVWKIRAYGFILKPYTKAQIIKMADWYKREHKTENQLFGGGSAWVCGDCVLHFNGRTIFPML